MEINEKYIGNKFSNHTAYLENGRSCTMVDTVIEVKDFLKTSFCCLVFTLDSVVTLVQLGFVGCAVALGTGLLDGGCWVHQVLWQQQNLCHAYSKKQNEYC